MKNEKGITLVSLMMYLIVLSIIMGISATAIKYFYKNTNDITISSDSNYKYTRLIKYISDDISSKNIISMKVEDNNTLKLYLKNGMVHEYFYDNTNHSIYYISWIPVDSSLKKEVQTNLCNNITILSFTQQSDVKFNINLTINGIEYKNVFSI